MRASPRAPTGPRHGHYPTWNYVRDQQDGTFRIVHQGHDLPDPGAQNYTYSTFMIPVQDLLGAGMPLTRGVPAACQPAQDMLDLPLFVLNQPSPIQQGTLQPMGLLPSDLVSQFSGKSV